MPIRKIKKLLLNEDSVSSAALIVSFTYLIAAFLGLLRNRLLATYFGDSVELGIFYMADKLPSFLFSFIVLTIVSSAFFPVFSEYKRKSIQLANQMISNLVNVSLLIYLFLTLLIIIFAKPISQLISWGSLDSSSIQLMTTIMQIILVSQVALILSSYGSSFLQSYKRFLLPSFLPIIHNTGIIIGTVFLQDRFGILAPAYGMVGGTLLGFIIQIPFLKSLNYSYFFKINFFDPALKKIFIIVLPRVLSISAHRLYVLVINGLISFVYKSPSYIVIYEFANQLQTMPVTAFGSSLSQAVFPSLSEYAIENKIEEIKKILEKYIVQLTYYMMPIVILFFVLRIPIIRILFGGDKFSWLGTNLTAYTLAFFSLSMWFQSVSIVLSKVFYSFQNSKIPTISSIISLLISFISAIVFALYLNYGVWSLALSFSIGSIIGSIYLFYKIQSFLGDDLFKGYYVSLVKIIYSTFLSGFVTYILMKYLDKWVFDTTRTLPLMLLTFLIVFIGFITYLIIGKFLGLKYYETLLNYIKRNSRKFLF